MAAHRRRVNSDAAMLNGGRRGRSHRRCLESAEAPVDFEAGVFIAEPEPLPLGANVYRTVAVGAVAAATPAYDRMPSNLPLAHYAAKLARRSNLPPEDRAALLDLPGVHKDYASGELIIASEDVPTSGCCVLVDGFASRFKVVNRSCRQIVSFAIPGDAIDPASILFMNASVHAKAHGTTSAAWLAHGDLIALSAERPNIARPLWLDTLIDGMIVREWTANIGQRRAKERIAHLLLELDARFQLIGNARIRSSIFQSNSPCLRRRLVCHRSISTRALPV